MSNRLQSVNFLWSTPWLLCIFQSAHFDSCYVWKSVFCSIHMYPLKISILVSIMLKCNLNVLLHYSLQQMTCNITATEDNVDSKILHVSKFAVTRFLKSAV